MLPVRARCILSLLCLLALHGAAGAQDRRHDGGERGARHPPAARWHGDDIRRFHEHDFDRWRGGRWVHGVHGGRRGWWWVVGMTWYFYPVPVYPYPDPYAPPQPVAPPPPEVPPQYWYYCGNPPGYYPYVPQCRVPWQRVPAAPP